MTDHEMNEPETVLIPADYDAYRSDDEREWQSFIDEMDESIDYAKITAYRVPTDEKGRALKRKMSFLFEAEISEYTFSQLSGRLRDEYGSGIYRLTLRDSNSKFLKHKTIAIEAPKNNSEQNTNSSSGELITRMSDAMEKQNERFEALLDRLTRGPATGTTQSFDQLAALMAGMAKIFEVMKPAGNGAPQKSAIEQLTEFKIQRELLRDIFGENSDNETIDGFWPAIASVTKNIGGPLMAAIAQAQTTGSMDQSGNIREPGPRRLPRAARESGPQTAPSQTGPSQTGPSQTGPSQTGPSQTGPSQTGPSQTGRSQTAPAPRTVNADASELENLKAYVDILCKQAANGVNPIESAEAVVNNLPDSGDVVDTIESTLKNPGIVNDMAALNPAVNQYRDWFNKWRTAMLKIFAEQFEDIDASPEPAASEPAAPESAAPEPAAPEPDDLTAYDKGGQDTGTDAGTVSATDDNGASETAPDDTWPDS